MALKLTATVKLPDAKNPYSGRTAFDILGVPPTAGKRELNMARNEKLQELEDAGHDDNRRIPLRKEIQDAYDAIRDPKLRVGVEIFFYDKTVGREECLSVAERQKKVTFDFGRILQRAEDIIPTHPEVQQAEKAFQPVTLQRSLRLQTEGHGFVIDPRAEAMDSIVFER